MSTVPETLEGKVSAEKIRLKKLLDDYLTLEQESIALYTPLMSDLAKVMGRSGSETVYREGDQNLIFDSSQAKQKCIFSLQRTISSNFDHDSIQSAKERDGIWQSRFNDTFLDSFKKTIDDFTKAQIMHARFKMMQQEAQQRLTKNIDKHPDFVPVLESEIALYEDLCTKSAQIEANNLKRNAITRTIANIITTTTANEVVVNEQPSATPLLMSEDAAAATGTKEAVKPLPEPVLGFVKKTVI